MLKDIIILKMRDLICVFIGIMLSCQLSGQDIITYTYDSAGNRTGRMTLTSPSPSSSPEVASVEGAEGPSPAGGIIGRLGQMYAMVATLTETTEGITVRPLLAEGAPDEPCLSGLTKSIWAWFASIPERPRAGFRKEDRHE